MSYNPDKPRTVVTTDGEVDDQNSVIRLLLYANEMDIAGIVLTSSVYHYAGLSEEGIEPFRWTGTKWLYKFLDAYEQVLPNLRARDERYPSASYLRQVTRIGNVGAPGEMGRVTEGSRLLEELFLDDDPRTLYVQTWGGTNTTARALASIEERYAATPAWDEVYAKVCSKLVVYIILDQDTTYGDYIARVWPDLVVLNDQSNFWHFAYAWQLHAPQLNETLQGAWCRPNLVDGKGPLMERYALMGDGKWLEGELDDEQRGAQAYLDANPNYQRYDFISEGDSPSFLYLVDTGLRSLEDPSWGGWGGRFGAAGARLWRNVVADWDPHTGRYEASYTLTRWFDDIQRDFACRTDWCLPVAQTGLELPPHVSVVGGYDVTAAPGERVCLTAVAEAPGGGEVRLRWWHYAEADRRAGAEGPSLVDDDGLGLLLDRTAEGASPDTLELEGADTAQVSFVVPGDAHPGDTIHMVATATVDGRHGLARYARVVVTVG